MRAQAYHGPIPRGLPADRRGLDPTRTDLGPLAIYLVLAGHYVMFVNLDDITGVDSFSNPIEKAMLFVGALYIALTRPLPLGRLMFLLSFAAVPAVSLLGTEYMRVDTGTFIRGFISYIVPWMLMTAIPREREALIYLKWLTFVPLFSVAVGIGLDAAGINDLWWQGYDGAVRLQGSTVPAFLSASAGLAAFSAMLLGRHVTWRYFILVAVNLIILALAGGRMGLAICLLSLGFVVLTRYKLTAFVLIGGVVGAVAMIGGAFLFLPNLILRLTENTDGGRALLWGTVSHVWHNYPYFGIGLGHQTQIVPSYVVKLTTTYAAHNEYLRLGVEIGWVGLIGFTALFISWMIFTWLNPPKAGDFLFPIVCLLFAVFCYTDNALSLPVIFGMMVAAYMERFIGVDKPLRI